jgi:hypothetical protein
MVYFFDFTINGRLVRDTTGSELANLADMRSEAVETLMAIAKDESSGEDAQRFLVTVRDGTRRVYELDLTLKAATPRASLNLG